MNANKDSMSHKKSKASTEDTEPGLTFNRRGFLTGLAGAAVLASVESPWAFSQAGATEVNLAKVAIASSNCGTSYSHISALNDGVVPASSLDRTVAFFSISRDAFDITPGDSGAAETSQWVQYEWSKPVAIDKIDIYWAIDRPRPKGFAGAGWGRMAAPTSYRILYWTGKEFAEVTGVQGLGTAPDRLNTSTFNEVRTNILRLELIPEGEHAVGFLEWKVSNAGAIPSLPPIVHAGVDRSVVIGGQTYLSGNGVWLQDRPGNAVRWSKVSGPGAVHFADENAAVTTATFSEPGDYVLALTGSGIDGRESSSLCVHAEAAPPKDRLDVVYTRKYAIDSPLWNARAKALIVNWIPHCIRNCERTDIPVHGGDGGIDNFIEAGKANRGEAHAPHKGYVFSNAWVHQTVESMCIALMVDPQGDQEIIDAQTMMRSTLERWIPIILGAQMQDGYLQTAYTLADRKDWPERWSPDHRGNHEGYTAGYFIESAINHYTLTDGKDLRLYNAAKRLADCWVSNIGPGKKRWYDGHQEMEQALVRFGRFVNDQEGNHRGDAYIALAKFLLDSREGGSEYDQSHLPPSRQYEAVGHAVRATYFYSGMADIAAETGDHDYQGAVMSLWDNMVNKKYYLTGGIGSGDTAEGFGPNYSLRNNAYCESCSSCGLIFFQYKLNLAYHDAKYADLYEQTMYNALLGSIDLEGKSYCYTNPLIDTERALWHTCPCCVGNIARTLLMMPTWTYVKSKTGVYVNLFVGSRIHVGEVAGTKVEMVQKTNYPWSGSIAITVNPEQARTFSVYVRVPNRSTSKLYTDSPAVRGLKRFAINGKGFTPDMQKGYAVITREWKAGDLIEIELPMEPQRVVADRRIKDDLGSVALKYGPLVYNVETADNQDITQKLGEDPLVVEWKPNLLGGVMAITGKWKDGSALLAIPNYARMNRVGPPPEYPGRTGVNYAPGATVNTGAATVPAAAAAKIDNAAQPNSQANRRSANIQSKVWI
jgi:DUF1680 family protein